MEYTALLDRPIFIIGCNRSGTTLLFRALCTHPQVWCHRMYGESGHVYHRYYPVHPELGERVAETPSEEIRTGIVNRLYNEAHNKEYFKDSPILRVFPRKLLQAPVSRFYRRGPIRLVEKTPANSLRVRLLATLFPEARFILLVRRPEDVISSLMEGWKRWSGAGPGLWRFSKWHYLAPPGWAGWTNRRLEEICAFQWTSAVKFARDDLQRFAIDRFVLIRHEDALANPGATYRKITEFCQLPTSRYFDTHLPRVLSRQFLNLGSPPRRAKWRELHEHEIEAVRPMFESLKGEFYPEEP